MAKRKNSVRKIHYGRIFLILLIVSVAFGFLFDAICSAAEKKIYPKKYEEYVEKYSAEYRVPPELVYSIIKCESNFDSAAVSGDGAIGLMQMMPSTFNDLTTNKLSEDLDTGMLYDPETNIKYGVYYLSYLKTYFDDWNTVAAAYNAGYNRVREWLKDKEYSSDGISLINSKIPYAETRKYCERVARAREKYISLYNSDT